MSGRVALVTGGTTGIGLATCRSLLADGCRVHAVARRQEAVDAAIKVVASPIFSATACDVTRPAEVDALVESLLAEHGRIDVLVACHGVYEHSLAAVDVPVAAFARVLEINVTGTFLVTQAVAQAMIERGSGGVIVLTGSVNGLLAEEGAIAYNASKAAVHSLTQTLAVELAAHAIRVVGIAPGWIRTPMTEEFVDADVEAGRLRYNPQARVARPEEVAGLIRFLCSDEASFMTGCTTTVDGGQTALTPPPQRVGG